MYLFGAFVSGWVKRRRGEIVAVGIVIMIVIVLLSGGGGQKQLRVGMCWWEGVKIGSFEIGWIENMTQLPHEGKILRIIRVQNTSDPRLHGLSDPLVFRHRQLSQVHQGSLHKCKVCDHSADASSALMTLLVLYTARAYG